MTLRSGAAAAAALVAAAGAGVYAVKAASSQVFGPSVYKGPRDRRSIALTFDDGPGPGTMELLEYLDQEGVRATFFVCGANVLRHPDITRAIQPAGHEIGNHTFSHPRLCPRVGWKWRGLPRQKVFEEFSRTQKILEGFGIHPALLRVPYGLRWFGLRRVQRELNLLSVMWTVIGHDWEWDAAAVAKHVLANATPGGIVCLHDGRDIRLTPDIASTIDAVKIIVPALKRRGYSFETVSQVLRSRERSDATSNP